MINLKAITPFALNEGMKGDGLYLPFFEELPLMQYTGLKDKNGKEIYEGDKLLDNSILNKEPERILTVEWRESECCFAFNEIPNSAFFPVYAPTLEIIGNVFENPELLTPPQP